MSLGCCERAATSISARTELEVVVGVGQATYFGLMARSSTPKNWLAAGILDLGHPKLLNRVDDVVRYRDVVELLRHLVALAVSPVEEFQLSLQLCRRRFRPLLRLANVFCFTAATSEWCGPAPGRDQSRHQAGERAPVRCFF